MSKNPWVVGFTYDEALQIMLDVCRGYLQMRMNLFDDQNEAARHPKQAIVDDFNRRFPPGTMVMLRRDSGRILTRVTRPAYLHGNTPVAFFKDVSGCYAIEGRVEAYGNG